MGAAAFLMAVVAEVEYSAVVLASIIPAVLYYVGLFLQIDLIAARDGIRGERGEGQSVLGELRHGWVFVLPFIVLLYGLFALVWRPEYAALMATASMIAALMIFGHRGKRPTLRTFADAMAGTADAAVSIVFIAAAAGIVIGALNSSGVLFNISEAIVDIGGRNLPLLLVLSAVMCIILGMGMPTVGVYALLSSLIAVPLVDLGIDKIAAHLFVLYLGMMSMMTPPVAIAAFAAAAIAGSGPHAHRLQGHAPRLVGLCHSVHFRARPGADPERFAPGNDRSVAAGLSRCLAGYVCHRRIFVRPAARRTTRCLRPARDRASGARPSRPRRHHSGAGSSCCRGCRRPLGVTRRPESGSPAQDSIMTRTPNFILFITDQLRADFLGCYGHPVVRTPHIDGLASRGLAFDRFYVSSPVCMPNRAGLMTGRWPSVSGVRANGIPLPRDRVTFVELLRAAGYRTALCGKSHLQNFTGWPPVFPDVPDRPGTPPPTGLTEALRGTLDDAAHGQEDPAYWRDGGARVRTPFYGFDHVDLVTGHGDDLGGDYRRWLLDRDPDATAKIGAANQLPHDYLCPQAVRTAIPEELYSTTYIAECAETFIGDHAGDRPFFLMVSFPDPHHPFNPPGRHWDMYDPDEMEIPAAFSRNDWVPPPHVQSLLEARGAGRANLEGMNTIGCSTREAQEARALTCGMMTMIDDAIGRVQQELRRSGVEEDTVVIFTSDHGENLGDHRLLLKGAECYEQVTRVPFIWCDPAADRHIAGQRTDRIGQTHDIGASILSRAGLAPFHGFQGQDVVHGPGRNAALIQYEHQRLHPGLGLPPRVHTLRTNRYRISYFEGVDWGELYDLEADPGEFENLWDDPAAAEARHALTERLLRAEIAATDRAPVPIRQA